MEEILVFIKNQIEKDKSEYEGDKKTKYNPGSKWSDYSWLVDEILMFLNKNSFSSYVLRKFGNKYEYGVLDDFLKVNFKNAYNRAEEIKNDY